MDGKPQDTGSKPGSPAEAQSNHFEMNTLEDSQTTTSNTQTHTEEERRDSVARALLCADRGLLEKV